MGEKLHFRNDVFNFQNKKNIPFRADLLATLKLVRLLTKSSTSENLEFHY